MSESIVKTEPETFTSPSSVTIECPNCEAQMEIQKLGITQNVTCEKCGTSGEIEIWKEQFLEQFLLDIV